MKNIYEVLRQKEQQSEELQKEIEALRLTIKILDGTEAPTVSPKNDSRSNGSTLALDNSPVAAGTPSKRFP